MKISRVQALELAQKYKLNLDIVPLEEWYNGLNVELEHGKALGFNVTDNNLDTTAKIALAHLAEFPDYYQRLEKMEKKATEHWATTKKPDIFKRKTSRSRSKTRKRKTSSSRKRSYKRSK